MRWYCVHPCLPLQAELRIRAAPDSSAAERGRISQGRAIAACSPAFQVRSDDAESDAVSWLQVAYMDAASGETEGGFMMATLPDGMALVIPWEETDFIYCCEVNDPTAQLFDGPQETAQCLGAVSSVNFLYCVVEETESRARISHSELESVWVDKRNLQVVCARLKHEECSTHHTFYELSDALPEEAQIAIREFPSKEARTVGLLSRGETLEVTVRGGNWLQIAGGSVDRAWIMWRTDALELLQEAPDVCSSTCERVVFNISDRERQPENQLSRPDSCGEEGIEHITGSRPTGQAHNAHGEGGNVQADATSSSAAEPGETEEPAAVQTAPAWEDRPIRPAPTPLDVQADATSSSAAEPGETEEPAAVQTAPAWEDRPIGRAPTPLDVQADATSSSAAEPGETEEPAAVQSAPAWEDRPIRRAPTPLDVQADATSSSAAEPGETEEPAAVQSAPTWEDRPIRRAPTPLDVQADATSSSAAEPGETEEPAAVQSAPAWEDRPIRRAPTPLDVQADATSSSAAEPGETEEPAAVQTAPAWEDRPIGRAPTPLDVQADATSSSAAEPGETEEPAAVQSAPAWEDRPIRRAPTPLDVQADATSSSAAEPGETEEPAAVQTAPTWEDRPIRRAPTPLDVQADATSSSAAEPGETEEPAAVQSAPAWEDRPIRRAPTPLDVQADATSSSAAEPGETEEPAAVQSAPAWEDRPIRRAPTPLDVQADATSSSAAEPGETEEPAAVQTAPTWENRPIRRAPTPLDVQADATSSSAAEPGETEEPAAVQTAPAWEDRPIRRAPTPLDVQADATSSSAAEPGETEEPAAVQSAPAWEDRPIRRAPTPLDVQADATSSSAAEPGETEEPAAVQTAPTWEDRPIRRAPTPLDVQADATSSSAAEPGETEEPAAVQTAPTWEDRPIRRAPTPLDVQADATSSSAAEPGETEEPAAVQTAPAWEDRPIRPAPTPLDVQADATSSSAAEPGETEEPAAVQSAPAWEDRPIRPAPTPLDVQADATSSSAAEPGETEEPAAVQSAPAWEDRPIRRAPTPLDVQADATSSSAAEPGETEEPAAVQTAPVWEDRPIRSTQTAHGEGDKDDSAVTGLAKIAYSQMLKYRVDFDKQYADHEITSGSESGEIALLGSLEDVFDPVDELLPAMPQEEAKRINNISLALLSTPLTESVPVGGADTTVVERDERSGDSMVLYHAGCAADGNVHAGNGSPTDGISYLQQVGVGKYCEHKQLLSAAGDELSQAMYEADQDDSDLVFQALVGDAPLSDDWFHVVAVRHHSADPHAIMPTKSAHASVDPKNTYELIMSDALPEEILASELRDDDDGDYDLISLFKYPLPTRRIFERVGSRTSLLEFQQLATPVGSANTPPVADQSAATISDNQASAEFAFTPTKSAPSKSRLGLQKLATGPGSIKKPLGSLARPQSFVGALPASALAKPARSGLPKPAAVVSHISPTQPSRSLLQPRSSLTSGSDTSRSSASSIPRKSFGFRRSSFKQ